MEQISSPFDGLYCEEGDIDACIDDGSESFVKKDLSLRCSLLEGDLFWTDDELLNLISKEKEAHLGFSEFAFDDSLLEARKEAVDWILRVKGFYGFSALSCVLAVNYFDRFFSSVKFAGYKPWMGQLVAVACLSLAAKMEETQVPLLIDFQVEDSKYVFEAKTIKRMELLVLSTLQWIMNPVTPISFIDHIVRRLGLQNNVHWDFLRRCEILLLSVISVMLHVVNEFEPLRQMDYKKQLLDAIKLTEEKVNQCYKLIMELLGKNDRGSKRKDPSTPGSPNGVIDAYFSGDSSNDSWEVSSACSLVLIPPCKRMRSSHLH